MAGGTSLSQPMPAADSAKQPSAVVEENHVLRTDGSRKRRRGYGPLVDSTERRTAPESGTQMGAAHLDRAGMRRRPEEGAQLTAVDIVKLRQRSAPQRLPAVDSKTYNLLSPEQKQQLPSDAPPVQQPDTMRQLRGSKWASKQCQPADVTERKPVPHNKRRTQQASGSANTHIDAHARAQRGMASALNPVAASKQRGKRKKGTGASRHAVQYHGAALVQDARPQTDGCTPASAAPTEMKRSTKRQRRCATTPGGTQLWVHVKPQHGK